MTKKKVYKSPHLAVAIVHCDAPIINVSAGGVGAGQSTNGTLSGTSGERERNSSNWGEVWNEGKE